MTKKCTIVNATQIAAPPSTKNKEEARDPEMRHSKKGNQLYFGIKDHLGVDADTCLVHQVFLPAFIAANLKRVWAIERDLRAMPSTRRNLFLLISMALWHLTEQRLFRISCPTLLLFGGYDELAGRAAQVDLATYLPNAVLAVMPDACRDFSLEQPMELAGRLGGFLDEAVG